MKVRLEAPIEGDSISFQGASSMDATQFTISSDVSKPFLRNRSAISSLVASAQAIANTGGSQQHPTVCNVLAMLDVELPTTIILSMFRPVAPWNQATCKIDWNSTSRRFTPSWTKSSSHLGLRIESRRLSESCHQ